MRNDEWRDKYLIGITEIDDDHQHLFDVIAMKISELILNKDKVQTYFSTKNIDDLWLYNKCCGLDENQGYNIYFFAH